MFSQSLWCGRKEFPHVATGGLDWAGKIIGATSEKQQQTTGRRTEEVSGAREKVSESNITKRGEKLKENMDRIIDEIDEVLEENAEDFVKNYIQRGGQ